MRVTRKELAQLIRESLNEQTTGDRPITVSEFTKRQDEIYAAISESDREQGIVFDELRTRVEKIARIVHELQLASKR